MGSIHRPNKSEKYTIPNVSSVLDLGQFSMSSHILTIESIHGGSWIFMANISWISDPFGAVYP